MVCSPFIEYGIDFEWLLEKCTIFLIVYEFGPSTQGVHWVLVVGSYKDKKRESFRWE
jgi:hypothetical protein